MNLLELAAIAPAVAVLVTASFSFCVLGATRYGESRRAEQTNFAWLLLALVAGLIVAALIVSGIAIIVA